jgi:hypothetical protein
MKSSLRWLIIFTIILGVLVIVTISAVLLTKDNEVALLPENTPEGTVQRYLIAIQDKDYLTAYNYLLFEKLQKSYDEWLSTVTLGDNLSDQAVWKATLGKTTKSGDYTIVQVNIDSIRLRGPLENPQYSRQIGFRLRTIYDKWYITSPTYEFWN